MKGKTFFCDAEHREASSAPGNKYYFYEAGLFIEEEPLSELEFLELKNS